MKLSKDQSGTHLMTSILPSSKTASAEWAFARYEQIRSRLPVTDFAIGQKKISNLFDLVDDIDIFLLDAFGVLNVGETPIPGAVERVRQLEDLGKKCFVLTNSASFSSGRSVEKFKKLGFSFTADQIISSRDAALEEVKKYPADLTWGVATTALDQLEELSISWRRLEETSSIYDEVDGFLFLSSADWTKGRQNLLITSLKSNPRPVIIGNPDLVAPQENDLSIEPGAYGHELADITDIEPGFFGKPYANIYDLLLSRDNLKNMPKRRIAMIGDTLHTDILGGAATDVKTVLVTGHGLLKGQDIKALIDQSGIVPDYIAPTT